MSKSKNNRRMFALTPIRLLEIGIRGIHIERSGSIFGNGISAHVENTKNIHKHDIIAGEKFNLIYTRQRYKINCISACQQ